MQTSKANAPTWLRPVRTAGHPPPNTLQRISPTGAGAARYNQLGGVGRDKDTKWNRQ